jgi:nucleoid-associated protein YgaU
MGLFNFVKNAGRSLGIFGGAEDEAPSTTEAPAAPAAELSDEQIAGGLRRKVQKLGLHIQHLRVDFADGTATVRGTVECQEDCEKVVMAIGNTPLVAAVNSEIEVDAPADQGPPAPECTWHTVASGDTLSAISQAAYGDPNLYGLIFEANKPMLADPNLIYPGQTLRIPPKPGAAAGRVHVVQPGDTLGAIAARYLGNPARYTEIFEANRHQLSDPNAIAVGQSLVIPV